ncbi:MAG: DUF11 domain-containing protein [Calothrix sp. SM1_7_51]|nr:DUF11 domain-containing protein [Calothrix sp. SM1_7_51]
MNRTKFATLGTIALSAAILLSGAVPGIPSLFDMGLAIAQNNRQSQLQLNLSAEKQVMTQDSLGRQKARWKALEGKATVQAGDVLRYTLVGQNNGDKPLNKLAFNQPIPRGMTYVLKSASADTNFGSKITFSIDGGRSFVENPTVQVRQKDGTLATQPAPAKAYTHIRWNFNKALAANNSIKSTYLLQVR